MFSFGFGSDTNTKSVTKPDAESNDGGKESEEVPFASGAERFAQESIVISEGLTLMKCGMSGDEVAGVLADGSLRSNDIVAGQYEGGFKLWEGATDLARFISQELLGSKMGTGGHSTMEGKRVLELGCGHGIPGLVTLHAGAEVHFQDYNIEVLREVTIPAVSANWNAYILRNRTAFASSSKDVPARFFSGHWASVERKIEELGLAHSYDVILTAETIYSLDSIASLLSCIWKCLKPGGIALVAAKTYYFGVGGGTSALKNMVDRDPHLRCTRTFLIDDPKSVQREIIELTALV